ncbi:TlpA disulfide reductase family protein [Lishizhenia sp.]|uniref:peroxiredoxin family protein n=1 Tax=Lishizhenia sp. TaxID=2497594 RepID=UPI00299D082C|nr:TlpA disulfide reductase family protein [Lishizhenia sp.]MDX1444598.1 TlpA disulfide reductase family protein [Lishizhenia sp.]
MKKIFTVLLLTITTINFAKANTPPALGYWKSELSINDSTVIPFTLITERKDNNQLSIKVKNASEVISLKPLELSNDTLIYAFKDFNSRLYITANDENNLKGYWQNLHRSIDYILPFKATYIGKTVEVSTANITSIEGKWKTVFNYTSTTPYPALGVFNHMAGSANVAGTFLTETGDYRFLDGLSTGGKVQLSCFDGSHAFLFEADLVKDTLWGTFYSGNHWKTKWYAVKDNSFTLADPDSLTYVNNALDTFDFTFKDLDGNDFTYSKENLEGKVVLIQIMGTWCPNCLDETKYYKELQAKYKDQGLEIIAVCYEASTSFESQTKSVKRLIDNYDLDYTFLIGGNASKTLASEQFYFLNEIISFPTSIYINKQGEIVKVHTGFNGPGTGQVYIDYKKETEALIEELLAD